MATKPLFEKASPYGTDLLALPVADVNAAAKWYRDHFGMTEIHRLTEPHPTVVMQRDQVRLGFAANGGDSEQDGAAIAVSDIHAARAELESRAVAISNWRIEERDGKKMQVFFVVAPDGLCYYFHQQID